MLSSLVLACAVASLPQDAGHKSGSTILRGAPEETVFCAGVSDLDALRADMRENAWYRMFDDQSFAPLRDWVSKKMAAGLADTEHGEEDVSKLFDSIHSSVAFFLVATATSDEPEGGLLIDPGTPRGAFEEVFDRFVERYAKGPAASTDSYQSIDLHLFEREIGKDASAKGPKQPKKDAKADAASDSDVPPKYVHVALFDAGDFAAACIAPTRERVLELAHGAIDRMKGKDPSPGFAGNELLADARKSVRSPGRLELFVDANRLLAIAKKVEKPTATDEKVMHALGVDGLKWGYLSGDVGKGESLGLEGAVRLPEQGYLRKFTDCLGKLPREFAKQLPKESTTVGLYQIDVWALYQAVWGLMQEIDPEVAEKKDEQMAVMSKEMGGGNIEQDFVAQLSGEFGQFGVVVPEEEWQLAEGMRFGDQDPPKGPLFGSAFEIGLKSAEKVSKFLDGVLAATGMGEQLATEEFQGTQIKKLGAMMPIQLSWAFTQRALLISQYPTALRAGLRAQGADAKDSVLENESFKPFFESHAQSSVLGLVRTADSVRTTLNTFQMLGAFAGASPFMASMGEGEDNPLALVPSGELADKYFHGTTVTALTKKGGVLSFEIATR